MSAENKGSEGLRQGEGIIRDIGSIIGPIFPKGWGFTLLCFTFWAGGYSTYISNAKRADMIKALRECADQLEKRIDVRHGELDSSEGHEG